MFDRAIDLNSLVAQLFERIPENIIDVDGKDAKDKATIYPNKRTHAFFQYHANKMNISTQSMYALTLNAIVDASIQFDKQAHELAWDRFGLLFQVHHIPQIHITKLLAAANINIPIQALTSPDFFFKSITPEKVSNISELFGVKSSWLEGASNRACDIPLLDSRDMLFDLCKQIKSAPLFSRIQRTNQECLFVISDSEQFNVDNSKLPPESCFLALRETYQYDSKLQITITRPLGITNSDHESLFLLKTVVRWCQQANVKTEALTVKPSLFLDLKRGQLPEAIISKTYPGRWCIDNLLTNNEEEATFAIQACLNY